MQVLHNRYDERTLIVRTHVACDHINETYHVGGVKWPTDYQQSEGGRHQFMGEEFHISAFSCGCVSTASLVSAALHLLAAEELHEDESNVESDVEWALAEHYGVSSVLVAA